MKPLINLQPKKAKIKYETGLKRTDASVDRFCLEYEDGDELKQKILIANGTKTSLIESTTLDPDEFSNAKSENISICGDLYECACLDTYNRFKANNIRLPYEAAIINWCKENNKSTVTILSFGSGGLLQEAILAERLKTLGITPSFICIDNNYPSDPNIEIQRQRKLRNKTADPDDFYEWMLTPATPIMLYNLRCIKAIEEFRKHASLQTFSSIADLSFALEHDMLPILPDLIVAIDLLAELEVPKDTRVSQKVIYEGKLQGYIGEEKYSVDYIPGENGSNRDWGWYNFSIMLLSSGLLKHNPKLQSIVAAYGMLKWFNGINEVRCEIPLPNVGSLVLGLDDKSPEVLNITPLHVALFKKNDISCHQFPKRTIIVTPQRAGFISPEKLQAMISAMFTERGSTLTEYDFLTKIKPICEQLDAVPLDIAYRFVGIKPPISSNASVKATNTTPWMPSFTQFTTHYAQHKWDYLKASMAIGFLSVAAAYKHSLR
jgi:hypothetical protein